MATKAKKRKKPSTEAPPKSLPKPRDEKVEETVDVKPKASSWNDDDPRFWQVALVLLLIGIALRQIALARAPYSSDEAIHAWFALGFENYTYDPVYHGPLLYHLLAGAYAFIKPHAAGEFVGRMVPSLLGIALLAITIGPARRWLGNKGALWSLALLAISPVMVAYHRVLIHDALVMLLTLGAVLCFQRSLETHSWTQAGRQSRIGLAALCALFLATKANAYFIIAMLLAFWIAALLVRKRGPLNEARALPKALENWLPLALFVLISIASHFALRDPDLKDYLARTHPLGMGPAFTFAKFIHSETTYKIICVFCVGLLGLWLLFAPRAAQPEAPSEEELNVKPKFDLRTPVLAAWVAVFLFAYLYGHGVFWWKVPVEMARNPDLWSLRVSNSLSVIKSAATGQYPFAPPPEDKDWTAPRLNEALDWDAATMAIPRMISYWGGQQKAPRLPGPHDYYLVLMLLYELPIVLAAIGGIIHASRHRTPFGDLLLWWAFTSFTLYALANEKVPWLLTHVMLPLILLAGMWLGALKINAEKRIWLYVSGVLGAIFLGRHVLATSFGRPNDQHEPLYYAQTTEAFRDEFEKALRETAGEPGDVWVDTAVQWPAVWYLRDGAPLRGNSNMALGATPPLQEIRAAVTSVETWNKHAPQLTEWDATTVDFFIWPRASWPAIRPDRYWNFWLRREVNPEYKTPGYREWLPNFTINDDSLLAQPGEWSHSEAIVAVKK